MIDARVRRFGRAWREDLVGQWQDLVGRWQDLVGQWEIWSDSVRRTTEISSPNGDPYIAKSKIPSHTGNLSAGGRQNKVSSGEWMLYGEIASIRRFYWEMVFDCCLKVISSKNQENSANQNGSLEQVGASRSMRTWIFFIIINTKNSISTNWGHFKMLQTQNWFV